MNCEADVTVIFDTDVVVWYEKRNLAAARLIDEADAKYISAQTYMEFLQGAQSPADIQVMKDFLHVLDFQILPLTENIGHRASIYIEEYAVTSGLRAGDAIIAATAVENNLVLATGNRKHFKSLRELKIKHFVP